MKIFALLANFALIPIVLGFVDNLTYGIWLTMNSVLTWLSILDIGIGNGLKNKLSISIVNDHIEKAKEYVSTAYIIFFIISIISFLIFFSIFDFIDWAGVFNASKNLIYQVKYSVLILTFLFFLQFVLNIITNILYAHQEAAIASSILFISNIFLLILILIFKLLFKGSLIILVLSNGLAINLVLVVASVYFFRNKFKAIKPDIKFFNLSIVKDLMQLSVRFFVIQTTAVVIFTSSNFLISHFCSPIEVVPFNISFRLFSVVPMIFTLILTPLWIAFNDAYEQGDILWIQNSIKKLIRVWIIFSIITLFVLIISPFVYKIWIGSRIRIPFYFSVFWSIYAIITMWNNIYAYFLNGIGKIKLSFLIAIGMVAIFPIIVYFFVNYYKFGSIGVVTSIILILVPSGVVQFIQTNKILKQNCSGIWVQ